MLPFGILIFVVGSLLIANAWAVIDAKLATTAAAREAARSYVESTLRDDRARTRRRGPPRRRSRATAATPTGCAWSSSRTVASPAAAGSRSSPPTRYPAISLPFGIGFGGPIEVRTRHSEIIDPLRSGLPAEGSCGY